MNKIGDEYFLSQIWVAGSAYGTELVKSRMEKRFEDGGMRSERHTIVGRLADIAGRKARSTKSHETARKKARVS